MMISWGCRTLKAILPKGVRAAGEEFVMMRMVLLANEMLGFSWAKEVRAVSPLSLSVQKMRRGESERATWRFFMRSMRRRSAEKSVPVVFVLASSRRTFAESASVWKVLRTRGSAVPSEMMKARFWKTTMVCSVKVLPD